MGKSMIQGAGGMGGMGEGLDVRCRCRWGKWH